MDRVLGGALRRGAGAPKGGAAPPAVEEAAAPVGVAIPSSSIVCAAGFGAEAGCWSAGGMAGGLRGLSAGPFESPPSNVSTCDPRMVGGGSAWELWDSPSKPPGSASIPSDEVEAPSEIAEISYLVLLSREVSRPCLVIPRGLVSERARDNRTRPSPLMVLELRETSDDCEARDESPGVPGGVIVKVDLTRPAIPMSPVGRPMRSCRCPADESSGPSTITASPACPACPAGPPVESRVRAAAVAVSGPPGRGEEMVDTSRLPCGVEEHDRSLASAEPAEVSSVGPDPLRGSAVGAAGGCTTNWLLSPGGAPG